MSDQQEGDILLTSGLLSGTRVVDNGGQVRVWGRDYFDESLIPLEGSEVDLYIHDEAAVCCFVYLQNRYLCCAQWRQGTQEGEDVEEVTECGRMTPCGRASCECRRRGNEAEVTRLSI